MHLDVPHASSTRPAPAIPLARVAIPSRAARVLGVVAVALGCAVPALAQRAPAQLDGAAILHRMQKLEVVGSVLYVAAHPDDENTRLISWLSNGKKVRTAYLSLTRGDGGQNLIGPELGDALGVLRTQELLEARRIDGGEQFFSRAVDFGYSKSADETFAKWGKQEVLADVVRVVRTFRPDVILTRFATDGSGGHGHHTASALLAHEAFELAADPAAFPEQIAEGLAPWRTQRLFFNASTFWSKDLAGESAKDPAKWVRVDVGGYDPLLGASYTEIAGRSRSQHKSQGFGAAETRGEQIEYLRLDKGAPLASADLFDGLDLGWSRFRGGAPVRAALASAIDAYDPRAPELAVPALARVVRELEDVAASDPAAREWARHQIDAARELMLHASGIVVEAAAAAPRVAAGDTAKITWSVLQRRPGPPLEVVALHGPGSTTVDVRERAAWNKPLSRALEYVVPREQPIDEPYWLAPLQHGIEPVRASAALFSAELRFEDGTSLRVERPATYTWVHRVAGERTRLLDVTPVAALDVVDSVVLVRGERASVSVDVEAATDDLAGELTATVPAGWTIESAPQAIEGLRRGERRRLRVDVRRGSDAVRGEMRFTFAGPKGSSDRTQHVIDAPHVLPQTWYSPATAVLVPTDVAVTARTVGYVEGAGDEIPEALGRLGVAVERIDPATARAADLARCDAIVTGIRAYNTVQELARFQATLLEYVETGGTLVVQYNTNGNDLVLDAKRIGPHPFSLTRSRVTVEEAKATFLAPEHLLLNVPNRLGEVDFEGWVQERGLYFAGDLDPRYTALIAWNDPGESPSNGGWIACDHGKGRFVYTGMSLFRQLPAGVAGSYRILANLVARRTARE